jgi:hypothetical protein
MISLILALAIPAMADEYSLLSSTGNAVVLWTVVCDPADVGSLPPGIWKRNDSGKATFKGQEYDGQNFVARKQTPAPVIDAGTVGTAVETK